MESMEYRPFPEETSYDESVRKHREIDESKTSAYKDVLEKTSPLMDASSSEVKSLGQWLMTKKKHEAWVACKFLEMVNSHVMVNCEKSMFSFDFEGKKLTCVLHLEKSN